MRNMCIYILTFDRHTDRKKRKIEWFMKYFGVSNFFEHLHGVGSKPKVLSTKTLTSFGHRFPL